MSFMITCPICGRRDLYEFRFGGEDRGPRPDQSGLDAAARAAYVHFRKNTGGSQREWWYHRQGCGCWFTVWRDTLTNREVSAREDEGA